MTFPLNSKQIANFKKCLTKQYSPESPMKEKYKENKGILFFCKWKSNDTLVY